MKKIIIVFAVIIAAAGAARWFFAHAAWKKTANIPAAGGMPEDFVLGVRDSVTYRLDDFLGKNIIVLAFLDNGVNSGRFEEACPAKVSSLFKGIQGLVWFNIKRDNLHAVIREQTKSMPLMYRTPFSNIPAYYRFKTFPSVLVIDRTGTIRLVYNGYSPTIFSDILNGLPETAK